MKNEVVKLGVIGYGRMGAGHVRNILEGKSGPRIQVAGVCDIDPQRLEAAKEVCGEIGYFDNAHELIDSGSVDAVLISTPHFDHPGLATQALRNNLHVLVEKPVGVFTKNVVELNKLAADSDRKFAMVFQQRQRGFYQKLKSLIDLGELGHIKRISWTVTDWYRFQDYYDQDSWRATWAGEGGGVLINQCAHQLDIWQWLFGMPEKIAAYCGIGRYHDIETEDDVTAVMQYADGSTGTLITTTGETPGTNRLEIASDMGKLVAENDELTFWRNRESERKFNREFKGGFGQPECWECKIPVESDTVWHEGIVKNFAGAILDDAELIAPGEDGIKSLILTNAILLSEWKNNQSIKLPFDDDEYYEILQSKMKTSVFHENKKTAPRPLDSSRTY